MFLWRLSVKVDITVCQVEYLLKSNVLAPNFIRFTFPTLIQSESI